MNMAKKKDLGLTVGEDSPFLEYSLDDFISWLEGRMLIAIGRGDLRNEIYMAFRLGGDWRKYNDAKREGTK
jgi:hypothetical protein